MINLHSFLTNIKMFLKKIFFVNSGYYWNKRYKVGGTSGSGSYNEMAIFKSQVINSFIQRNKIRTIMELGCGDGSQISLGLYPNYLGFDISPVAIKICKDKFSGDTSKDFKLIKDYANEKADLVLSLDVIYHLVENKVYQDHMKLLFNASNHFVIIYSSNTNEKLTNNSLHVRNRKFTDWIDTNCVNWKLVEIIPNKYPSFGNPEIGSFADFFIYQKNQQG